MEVAVKYVGLRRRHFAFDGIFHSGRRSHSFSLCILLLQIIHLYLSFHQVVSKIVVIPLDTEVRLNQSTYLNCTTDHHLESVFWYHYRAGNLYHRLSVYDGSIVESPYRQRFRIEGERGRGEFNLVIESVESQDAGKYECQDEGGVGEKRSANIVVLEDELQCSSDAKESGVIGPNDCGLSPDSVRLSCRVRFQGEVAPKLKWRVRNGDVVSNDSLLCWTSTNELTCNTTIRVDRLQLSETSFVCETSRMIGRRQINCTIDQLTIMYAFGGNKMQMKNVGDAVNCSANSSQPCLYRWNQVKNEGKEVNVSENAVFVPQVDGWYKCLARCSFGDKVCALEVINVLVFSSQGHSSESDCSGQRTPSYVPWLTSFGTAAAVAFAAAVGILITVKKKRRRQKGRSANEVERETLKEERGQLQSI